MNDADGFRLEAGEQFGARSIDTDGRDDYVVLTEAQLIAFAKSCERKGMAKANGIGSRLLVARLIAESDAELAPLLEAERQRCLAAPAAPTFQPGQTYLTQGGQAMRIERWSGADGRYATEQSRRPVWYREDGKCDVREWSHYDLLPGALEEVEQEVPDPAVAILQRLYQVATEELRNTSQLMSYPPQSSAAWDIRNAISKELEKLGVRRTGK